MPHVLFWVGLMTLALPARAAEPIHILAFGDSLTAGYNLPTAESFAAQLEKRLQDAGSYTTYLFEEGTEKIQ